MSALLKAETDLLWFGGIGTYVKLLRPVRPLRRAATNDAIRVDGRDLRAKVVGEGANLGVTQPGRGSRRRAGCAASTPTPSTIRPASIPPTTRSI